MGRSFLSAPTSAATSLFRPHPHCLPPPPAVSAKRTWGPEFADTNKRGNFFGAKAPRDLAEAEIGVRNGGKSQGAQN